MAQESSSSGGLGFFGALGILFIALKLTATGPVASWSWLAVTSPLWGGLALALVIMVMVILWECIK